MYSSSISRYSINAVPRISPRINDIYLNGLIPFVFAVLISVYTPTLVSAPFGFTENSQFFDTPNGASANALYLTIVEIVKAYDLNLYEYLKYLLEHRSNKDMTDDELAKLAPWSKKVQIKCSKKNEQKISVQRS